MWYYAINESGEVGEIIAFLVVFGIPFLMSVLILHDWKNGKYTVG